MKNNTEGSLRFVGYALEKINFAYNGNINNEREERIHFNISGGAAVDEENRKLGRVVIEIKLINGDDNNDLPFELQVRIAGDFENVNIEDDKFEQALRLNGTTVLFPFLRSAVADITKAANVPAFVLPLMNIHKLIENHDIKKD